MENTIDKYSFGKFIRETRELRGITLRKLAGMMKISPSYLSEVENGIRCAPLKVNNGKNRMADFINFLGITADKIPHFYNLAYATRMSFPDIDNYLANNPKALAALRLAKDINIPDSEWDKFTATLMSLQ